MDIGTITVGLILIASLFLKLEVGARIGLVLLLIFVAYQHMWIIKEANRVMNNVKEKYEEMERRVRKLEEKN